MVERAKTGAWIGSSYIILRVLVVLRILVVLCALVVLRILVILGILARSETAGQGMTPTCSMLDLFSA